MNRPFRFERQLTGLLFCALLWMLPAAGAWAQVTCNITATPSVSFGEYGSVNGNSNSAPVSWSCNNTSNKTAFVTLCINIGAGSGGVTATSRLLSDGKGHTLGFQLYKASNLSSPWGGGTGANSAWTRQQASLRIDKDSSNSAFLTVYGSIPSGQTVNVPAGTYTSSFNASNMVYSYNTGGSGNESYPASCDSGGTLAVAVPFTFTSTATVGPNCSVLADSLIFSTPADFLTASIDGTTQVHVTCAAGIPYQIGLDNGLNFSATRRMAGGSSSGYVGYELYKDSNRSLRWGNTPGTDTLTGSPGTGNSQTYTVYGQVPVQSTPSPDKYSDTITVKVTY